MLLSEVRVSNKFMTKIALAFVAAMGLLAPQVSRAAQDKPADQPAENKKVAKDQQEADLINSLPKETDPAKRLATLDKWKAGYPETAFSTEREAAYLATYQELKKPRETVDTANQILKRDPNNFDALRAILIWVPQLGTPPPQADMDNAEKVANHFIHDADQIFTTANKPPYMNDQQWQGAKEPMRAFSQRTIGMMYAAKKDNERAETELTKALQMSPNDSQIAYQLGAAILAQNKTKPEKQPLALFYYARAAAYDGQGSLPAANRQQIQGFVSRAYTTYHGSNEGFDKLLATAKANATPPADFRIDSTADIATAKAKAEEEAAKANPMLAMWKTIKTGLTGDNPDQFFESTVKDAALPGGANGVTKFKGKLISAKPETRPKELVIAVEKGDVADCTIKIDEGTLPGKMDPGGEIEFEGVAKAYTKEPYTLTLETEKDKIVGWTGKNAPVVKKAPAAKKKAQ
jgi:tetratricopeptide (TPR) repeat protein